MTGGVAIQREIRANDRIRAKQVRVIGADGSQLGVLPLTDALRQARDEGFDLVEVAATASPPVCRIMDFSRYKYAVEKQERSARKKQHVMHIKEVKFKARIEEHDYQVKLQRIRKFLSRGDKTKVTLMFRGREMSHTEVGQQLLRRVNDDVIDVAKIEKPPKLEGRFLTMVLSPK